MDLNNILDYPCEINIYLDVHSLEEIVANFINVDDEIENNNMKCSIVVSPHETFTTSGTL